MTRLRWRGAPEILFPHRRELEARPAAPRRARRLGRRDRRQRAAVDAERRERPRAVVPRVVERQRAAAPRVGERRAGGEDERVARERGDGRVAWPARRVGREHVQARHGRAALRRVPEDARAVLAEAEEGVGGRRRREAADRRRVALERAQVAVVVERQVAHARPGRRVGDDHAELGVAEARRADAPGGAADLLAQDAAQAVEDADHAVARRRHAPAAAAVEAEAHTGRARAAEDLGDPELPGGVHVLAA